MHFYGPDRNLYNSDSETQWAIVLKRVVHKLCLLEILLDNIFISRGETPYGDD